MAKFLIKLSTYFKRTDASLKSTSISFTDTSKIYHTAIDKEGDLDAVASVGLRFASGTSGVGVWILDFSRLAP